MKLKLLVIAFPDSIHTARWISQLDKSKFEVHLFPSVLFKEVHPGIADTIVHAIREPGKKAVPGPLETAHWGLAERVTNFFPALGKKFVIKCSGLVRAKALARLIRQLKPDIVHTMESQQAGYLFGNISQQFDIPWVHSTWGIDLHYFQDMPGHKEKLMHMLRKVSMLVAEGERDIRLARQLGYKKESIVIPSVGGGINLDEFNSLPFAIAPSLRKKIIIKGYEGHERLASNALLALRKIKDRLQSFQIIVYSCSELLVPLIGRLKAEDKLDASVLKDTSRSTILELTACARVSITNNLSDGVPNTMLEAMALGAFPIQSNTAITEGWITDGKNGLITEPGSVDSIASAILRSVTDDELVDGAAILNREMIREKLDISLIKHRIERVYLSVAPGLNGARH